MATTERIPIGQRVRNAARGAMEGLFGGVQPEAAAAGEKSAPKADPKPDGWDREVSWGGATIMGGVIRDEHKAELVGLNGIRKAAEMRRSDAQVRCVEQVIGLPIRATEWDIVPPEGAGSAETEATELLKANLFGGMETSWDDLLREASLAIYFGFRTPEIVWEERRGVIAVEKIASRNPERVEQWLWDERGRLIGQLYVGQRPQGSGLQTYPLQTSTYERVAIPREKFIHFCYDAENERPDGFGLWRSMHPHWFIKQALYVTMCMGIERNYLETPVGRITNEAKPSAREKLLGILTRWRVQAGAAVVLAEGEDLDFKGGQRGLMDALPFVEHHDNKILQSGLCTFLNLGQGATGTQALASELTRTFEQAEDAKARWIEQTINSQLVRRWVLYNYGVGLRPPRVTHRPIQTLDLRALGEVLNNVVNGKWVTPLPEDEVKLRNLINLPAIPLDQLKQNAQERQQREAERDQALKEASRNQPPPNAPVQARERIDLDACGTWTFAETATKAQEERDKLEQRFAEQARERLEAMQEGYFANLRPLLEDHAGRDKIAKGLPLQKLSEVGVPGWFEYRDFVRGYLWDVLQLGRQALATETGQDIEKRPVSNELRNWVTVKASVIADSHTSQLRTATLDRVLTGVRAQMEPAMIFSDAGATAIDVLTRAIRDDYGLAAAEILAHLGLEA